MMERRSLSGDEAAARLAQLLTLLFKQRVFTLRYRPPTPIGIAAEERTFLVHVLAVHEDGFMLVEPIDPAMRAQHARLVVEPGRLS